MYTDTLMTRRGEGEVRGEGRGQVNGAAGERSLADEQKIGQPKTTLTDRGRQTCNKKGRKTQRRHCRDTKGHGVKT